MKTYYIFIINDNCKRLYKNNSKELYSILEIMYNSKKNDILLCTDIYKQVVNLFNKRVYDEFIYNKYKTDEHYSIGKKIHYYNIGNTKNGMIIYNSHIRIATNKESSIFFNDLNFLSKGMFVCNFDDKEYFFLESKMNILQKEYIFSTI